MLTNFYQLNYTDLQNILAENEINIAAATLLFRHHYKEKKIAPCAHHNLSKHARKFIENNFVFDLPEIEKILISEDLTVKFLFKLKDKCTIESVIIPYKGKYTLCISTQVGCAMNCAFCFTGTQGLKRHLSADEIIGQFIQAWQWLINNRPDGNLIRNIVYMGQGEPLHNFDAVKKSTEIFLDNHGSSIGAQRITISTAGYLPGLKRLIEEMPNVNIALSLHSAFTEKRNILIPINQRYPLSEVITYLDLIPLRKKQFVTYEYLIIKDFNDAAEDAHAVGELLKNRKALINLIPFNPFPESKFERPESIVVKNFLGILESYRIPTMIRSTKGDDILAACGQLKTVFEK
jgi:23S rRNA (adenine2503-C2)-methyltransferase